MYSNCGNGMPEIFGIVLVAFVFLTVLVLTLLTIVVWWKICRKAGYSGWLSLLILVPVGGFILAVAIAFMDWPVLRELRALKQAQTTGGQEPGA